MSNDESRRTTSRMLDAGIVIAAVVVGFVLGRTTVTVPPARGATEVRRGNAPGLTGPIGKTVALPGVNWEENRRTLVLVLQTGCRFCSESGPFYKRLAQERVRFGGTKFLAILPQTVEESKVFLSQLGITVDDIRQGALSEIGVRGTPTLLLVNSAGVVTEAWPGKLPPSAEEAVILRLIVDRSLGTRPISPTN